MLNCDIVCYNFVKERILDAERIIRHDKEGFRGDDYKYRIFNYGNDSCNEVLNDFKSMVSKRKYNYHQLIRSIIPTILYYAEETDYEYMIWEYIKENDDVNLFCLYSLSIAEEIIEKYEDYINDILNNTTAKGIAINKLKRNRIVNEGILLRISMKECGMF